MHVEGYIEMCWVMRNVFFGVFFMCLACFLGGISGCRWSFCSLFFREKNITTRDGMWINVFGVFVDFVVVCFK